MSRVLALHGFLGCGGDWDAVRAASHAKLEWMCPDLFAPGPVSWRDVPKPAAKAWLAGYSFGARLALRLLKEEPERWHGALLVSVNPGNFMSDAQREARRADDLQRAQAFRRDPWDRLMEEWNTQDVFRGSAAPARAEGDFDRAKLADALENFSVAGQFTDPSRLQGALVWLAGEEDAKFRGLLDSMRNTGFPGSFFAVPGAGHRLLLDAPDAVAAALDRLVAAR